MTQLFRPALWEPGWQPPRDPMTMMAAAMIGTQVIGTLSSADAQRKQGKDAQDLAYANQSIFNQQANQAIAESEARAEIQARQASRNLGSIKAAYGASGVEVESGTPLEVLGDQASEMELQRQLTLWKGKADATALNQRGALAAMGGEAAAKAGDTAANSTLLTGFAKAGMNAFNLASTTKSGTRPTFS